MTSVRSNNEPFKECDLELVPLFQGVNKQGQHY